MEGTKPKISFKVTPKKIPPNRLKILTNLSQGEEHYCVLRWGSWHGGTFYYDVWCECKNLKIAKQIAKALNSFHKEGKLDVKC